MKQKSKSDMKFFSNNHLKRKTTSVMLALWLLAAASGVANACLLDAQESTSHGVVAETIDKAHASTVLHAQPVVAIYHGQEADTSRSQCLKVCDDGSQALQKKSAESDLTYPGPAFVVATLWDVATPVLLALPPREDLPLLIAGPSLQIRHSRWAL